MNHERLLVIYAVEPPKPPLIARLTLYGVKLLAAASFTHPPAALNLRAYDVLLIYAPDSLHWGRSFCTEVRRVTPAPLLLLSPTEPAEDAYLALTEGVDMLLPPGVDPAIAAGHVAALLRFGRRTPASLVPPPALAPDSYRDGVLEIDLPTRTVRVHGRKVHLTPTEFRLLSFLVLHGGQLVTYAQILNYVWGLPFGEHRIIHTFVAQVRAKLGQTAAEYIASEYGIGYRFSPPTS